MRLGTLQLNRTTNLSALVYLVTAALCAVAVFAYTDRFLDHFRADDLGLNDFKGVYAAVLIHNGQNPYDYSLTSQLVTCTNCPYQYPPLLASLLLPIIDQSPMFVQRVWLIANQILLVLTIYLAIRIVDRKLPVWLILLSISAILGFYPLWTNLGLGNVTVLLGFLVTLAYWFWQRDQRLLAGLCIGLGIAVKYVPALLLVYFFWKKEYRMMIYTILFAIFFLILPDIILRTSMLMQYVNSLTQVVDRWYYGSESFIDNQSFNGFFARLYVLFAREADVPSLVKLPSLFLTGLLGLTILFLSPRDRKPSSPLTIIEYSLMLFLFPLGSPNSWSRYYAWIILIVPALLYLLWSRLPSRQTTTLALMAGIGFVLASQPYRIPRLLGVDAQVETLALSAFGVLLQSVLVYGVVLILIIGLVLLWTNRREDQPARLNSVKPI